MPNHHQKHFKKTPPFKNLHLPINFYLQLLFFSLPLIHIFKSLPSLPLHLIL
nr:hypothetical protein [Bacillus subtilis]